LLAHKPFFSISGKRNTDILAAVAWNEPEIAEKIPQEVTAQRHARHAKLQNHRSCALRIVLADITGF